MSTASPTSRLGLIAPNGDDPINNGDDLIRAIVAALDAKVVVFDSGTAGSRPGSSPGTPGIPFRLYRITTGARAGQVDFDYGTGWVEDVFGSGLQLGTTDTTAAAGNHTHTRYVERTFTRSDESPWPSSGVKAGQTTIHLAPGETRMVIGIVYYCDSGSGTVLKLRRAPAGSGYADVVHTTSGSVANLTLTATPQYKALETPLNLADLDRLAAHVVSQGTGLGGEFSPVYSDTI